MPLLSIRQLRALAVSGLAAVVIIAGLAGVASVGKKYLPKRVALNAPSQISEASANNAASGLSAISRTATLVVDKEMYVDEAREGATVYDMMKRAQELSTLRFRVKESEGLGAFVEEINDMANDSKANVFWMYYVNGEPAKVGISSQIVKAGDRVEWKYEKVN